MRDLEQNRGTQNVVQCTACSCIFKPLGALELFLANLKEACEKFLLPDPCHCTPMNKPDSSDKAT